jgi:hypothetical protein
MCFWQRKQSSQAEEDGRLAYKESEQTTVLVGNHGSNAEAKDTRSLVVLRSDAERAREQARPEMPHQTAKILVLPARAENASDEKTRAQTKERNPGTPELDEGSFPNFSEPQGRMAYFSRGCYAGRGLNVRKLIAPVFRLQSRRERIP